MGDNIAHWLTLLVIVKQVDVSLPHFIQLSCLLYENIGIRIIITDIDRLSNFLKDSTRTTDDRIAHW